MGRLAPKSNPNVTKVSSKVTLNRSLAPISGCPSRELEGDKEAPSGCLPLSEMNHYAIDVWTMDKLIDQVGSSVDKAAALKALLTWVDLGVLKEEGNNTFSLLEVADAAGTTPREPRAGTDFIK